MNENLKPGDFPIGSPESRAAARLLLTTRTDPRKRFELVTTAFGPGEDSSKPHATPWIGSVDGVLTRILQVPAGMTDAEARTIVGDEYAG